MQIVIDIPNAPINDYRDLYYKIHCMAASEGLFDDKVKSQRALALKVVLNVLEGVVEGTPLPKGHGRLIDADSIYQIVRPIEQSDANWGMTAETAKRMIYNAFNKADTIIEADKKEEDESKGEM